MQKGQQLKLQGLPKKNPDRVAQIAVIEMEFASVPKQQLGAGCVLLK